MYFKTMEISLFLSLRFMFRDAVRSNYDSIVAVLVINCDQVSTPAPLPLCRLVPGAQIAEIAATDGWAGHRYKARVGVKPSTILASVSPVKLQPQLMWENSYWCWLTRLQCLQWPGESGAGSHWQLRPATSIHVQILKLLIEIFQDSKIQRMVLDLFLLSILFFTSAAFVSNSILTWPHSIQIPEYCSDLRYL